MFSVAVCLQIIVPSLCIVFVSVHEQRHVSLCVLVALKGTLLGPLETKTQSDLIPQTDIHTSNMTNSLCVLSGKERREILLAVKEQTPALTQ